MNLLSSISLFLASQLGIMCTYTDCIYLGELLEHTKYRQQQQKLCCMVDTEIGRLLIVIKSCLLAFLN